MFDQLALNNKLMKNNFSFNVALICQLMQQMKIFYREHRFSNDKATK